MNPLKNPQNVDKDGKEIKEPFGVKNIEGVEGAIFRISHGTKRKIEIALLGAILAGGTGLAARTGIRSAIGYGDSTEVSATEVTGEDVTEETDEPKETKETEELKKPTDSETEEIGTTKPKYTIDYDAGDDSADPYAKFRTPHVSEHTESMGVLSKEIISEIEDTKKMIAENADPKKIYSSFKKTGGKVMHFITNFKSEVKKAAHEAALGIYEPIDPWIIPVVFMLTIIQYLALARLIIDFKSKTIKHSDQAMVQGFKDVAAEINLKRSEDAKRDERISKLEESERARNEQSAAMFAKVNNTVAALRSQDITPAAAANVLEGLSKEIDAMMTSIGDNDGTNEK